MNSLIIRCLFIILVLFLFPGKYLLYGQTTVIKPKPKSKFSLSAWSYLTTSDKAVLINDVIARYAAGEFKPVTQAALNAGIPRQYYWIHFDIANNDTSSNDLIIDIDNARLNEMELFEVSNSGAHSLGKLGDLYPFGQRAILHKNFLYQVLISPHQKKEFFLFVNQVGHAFTLPVKMYSSKNFRSTTFKDYLFDGVTYGVLLFVAVLSLLFFITSGYTLYLYYGLYIITAIIWFLSYFGLGYQYIWSNYPALNTSIAPFMACINILLNLQICQILLRLSKTKTPLNSLANYIKCLLIIIALCPFAINLNKYGYAINHTYLICFLGSILIAMIVVSYSVILYAVKGFIPARFYLVASLSKAVSIFNLALLELGITPALYNMEGLLQIGIFIEITLLTYALATRYTNFKVKTFVKVIEAHEKERSLISKEIHDSISNTLTGINMGIKNFTRDIENLPEEKRLELEKIFDELNKVKLEARNISHNTMPDYIKNRSISSIVEKHVEEIQVRVKNNSEAENFIQINFSANEQLVNFSDAVKLNIFRIVQEILTNILKHSKATTVDMLFSFSKKEMMIIAEDNGKGFIQESNGKSNGMGVRNIRSRVELLDGNIVIKSPILKREPDSSSESSGLPLQYGTMIKIKIPYKNRLLKITTNHDY